MSKRKRTSKIENWIKEGRGSLCRRNMNMARQDELPEHVSDRDAIRYYRGREIIRPQEKRRTIKIDGGYYDC
jgi:hypothetical protein